MYPHPNLGHEPMATATVAKTDRASLFSKESVVQLPLADSMENNEFPPQLALYIESLQHPLNMFPSSLVLYSEINDLKET